MKGLKNVGKGVGEVALGPFAHAATGVESIVSTAHHDAVGISKGVYNIANKATDYTGTALTQLTSPNGLIAIAAIIGGIALIGIVMSRSK